MYARTPTKLLATSLLALTLPGALLCAEEDNLSQLQAAVRQESPLPQPLPTNSYQVYSITGSKAQIKAQAKLQDPTVSSQQQKQSTAQPYRENRVNVADTRLTVIQRPTFGVTADNATRARKLLDRSEISPTAEAGVKASSLPDYVHFVAWEKDYYVKFTAQTRADMIFDDVRGMGSSYSVTGIPVGSEKRVFSDMSSNEAMNFTYFSFEGVKPTDLGNAKIAVDSQLTASTSSADTFSSDTPNQQPAVSLRNLYGQLGGLAVGFAESAFADNAMTPDLLNHGNLFGVVQLSNPSIRYIYTINPEANFTVSLEKPATNCNSIVKDEKDSIFQVSHAPDVAVRYKQVRDQVGHIQIAGVFRSLGASDDKVHDDAFGYGIHASGFLLFQHDCSDIPPDFFGVSGVYGRGIGRYDSQISNLNYADCLYSVAGNELTPLRLFSGLAGYTHFGTRNLRSTGAFGYGDLNTPFTIPDPMDNKPIDLFRRGYFASVNTFYVVNALTADKELDVQNPSADLQVAQVQIGLELIHGHQEMSNGREGESNRIQFSIQINR